MTLEEYEQQVQRTLYPNLNQFQLLLVAVLGLAGESGEIADSLKKDIAQQREIDEVRLAEELGDVLWYAALLARVLGKSLAEILHGNVEKLRSRHPAAFADAEEERNPVPGEERAERPS